MLTSPWPSPPLAYPPRATNTTTHPSSPPATAISSPRELACLGFSPRDSGIAAGNLAGRVLLGEKPKDLALEEVMVEEKIISRSSAERLKIAIPAELAGNVRP